MAKRNSKKTTAASIEIDWKKVAAERLGKIHCLEHQFALLKEEIEKRLDRELAVQFHSMCFPMEMQKRSTEIAEIVAERLRPKLWDR